jgi:hypothetical protein
LNPVSSGVFRGTDGQQEGSSAATPATVKRIPNIRLWPSYCKGQAATSVYKQSLTFLWVSQISLEITARKSVIMQGIVRLLAYGSQKIVRQKVTNKRIALLKELPLSGLAIFKNFRM